MKVETKIKPQVEDLKLVNKSRNPFTIIQFDSIHIVFVDKNDGPLLWDLSPEKVNVSYSKPKYCVNMTTCFLSYVLIKQSQSKFQTDSPHRPLICQFLITLSRCSKWQNDNYEPVSKTRTA